jgi:membrane protein DedA with SNARE-associated domain
MLHSVVDLVTGSPVTYVVVCALVAADAVFPLIPAETVCLTAGVVAANDELTLALVLIAAAVGGAIGDNASYGIGALVGSRARRRLLRGRRARAVLEWVRRHLGRHPVPIILTARFLPGGRTATSFASGTAELSWRRFATIDGAAVCLWAAYSVLLGYLGGEAFANSLWKPLLVAGGVAALVSSGAELARRRAATPTH